MPSQSNAQKVGIPQKVAREFQQADKGSKKKLPERKKARKRLHLWRAG